MKVQCSGCAARYAIDDGLLHGRSARIRCKRCGAAIVVRSEPIEHFVLVGETQRGPFERDALERAIRAGEVGRDALVWHAGLSEWTALTEVPGLAACLPVEPALGARHESSVLFSLGTLRELATAPARPVLRDGSGLIDIRALAHVPTPTPAAPIDLLEGVGPAGPGVPWVSIAAPRARGPALPLAVAMLVASILVVGALVAGRGTRGVEPPAAGSVVEPPRALAAREPATPSAPVPIPAPTPEPSAPPALSALPIEEPATRDARTARARPRPARVEAPSPEPVVPARTEATDLESLLDRAAPASELPDTPSRDAVRRAMDALGPRVRACGARGRVLVRVVVAGDSGRARSVTSEGAPPGTEACIAEALRALALDRFRRSVFTVAYPYVL